MRTVFMQPPSRKRACQFYRIRTGKRKMDTQDESEIDFVLRGCHSGGSKGWLILARAAEIVNRIAHTMMKFSAGNADYYGPNCLVFWRFVGCFAYVVGSVGNLQ